MNKKFKSFLSEITKSLDIKEGTGYSDEEVKSGKQRSGRPYPEAKFPGWKVGKNMQTQKAKNGKKIGAARTIAAVKEETAPSRGATRKQLDAEKIMDYRAAQKFYEKDMPNQIMRARLEDRKRTAAKNSVKEDVEQVDEAGQAKLYRMRYSHGRAWRRGDKKKQDAMGVATYDKQKKEDAKDLNRTGSAFGMRVKRLAGNRKAMGYSESTLIGKQKKLDVNKNKRLDAGDFKALRAKRTKPER